MSDTKAFVLEYYSVNEKFNPLNFLNKDSDVASEVISNVQQAAGVPPGVTSRPSTSNTPVPGVPQVGSNSSGTPTVTKPRAVFMGQDLTPTLDAAGRKALEVGDSLIGKAGDTANQFVNTTIPQVQSAVDQSTNKAITGAETAARNTLNYGASLVPQTSRQAGSEFTQGVTSSLGKTFSDPKTLAKLGVGALATGALVGGGMALGNRLFGRRPEKKKKRNTAITLTASYNPYVRSRAEIGGAVGATGGSLAGLLGGRYAGARAADLLGLKQGGLGRTALEIGGQALGTVAGGTLGGIGGFELGKKRKKKKNEMLPQSMYA